MANYITSKEITGDSTWAKRARHQARVLAVRDAAAQPGSDKLARLLVWAESHAVHPTAVEGRFGKPTPPTTRPAWWSQAGLPPRRQQVCGAAWTAAAAELARRNPIIDNLPELVDALVELGEVHDQDEELFPAWDVLGILAAVLTHYLPALDPHNQRVCKFFSLVANIYDDVLAEVQGQDEETTETC
jgi:hypothetical protein